jgi:hypothetical protein
LAIIGAVGAAVGMIAINQFSGSSVQANQREEKWRAEIGILRDY